MTNEEAIKEAYLKGYDYGVKDWFKSKTQPCEDAISRKAVLEGLASIAKAKAKSDAQKSMMGRCMFFVEQLPPVTPERPNPDVVEKMKKAIDEMTEIHSDGEFYIKNVDAKWIIGKYLYGAEMNGGGEE